MCLSNPTTLSGLYHVYNYKRGGTKERGEYCMIWATSFILQLKRKFWTCTSQRQPLSFTNEENNDQRCNVLPHITQLIVSTMAQDHLNFNLAFFLLNQHFPNCTMWNIFPQETLLKGFFNQISLGSSACYNSHLEAYKAYNIPKDQSHCKVKNSFNYSSQSNLNKKKIFFWQNTC
jgi:hypothetical protein